MEIAMPPTELKVYLATEEDVQALCQLSEKTFIDTYKEYNTPENMQKHISEKFSFAQISEEIQNVDNQYFIIKNDCGIAGFAKLIKNHTPAEIASKHGVEIERFYIDKIFHGQNLGRKLMDFCAEWAINSRFEVIWLGVWEQNYNALKFYQKMGFEQFGSHVFVLGEDVQNDFLMKKDIF